MLAVGVSRWLSAGGSNVLVTLGLARNRSSKPTIAASSSTLCAVTIFVSSPGGGCPVASYDGAEYGCCLLQQLFSICLL